MHRKLFVGVLCITTAVSLAGCGSSKDTTASSQPDAVAANSPDTQYVASDAKGVPDDGCTPHHDP